jgi:hypothetical protein
MYNGVVEHCRYGLGEGIWMRLANLLAVLVYNGAVVGASDYRPLDEAVPHSQADNLPYPSSQNAPPYMPTPQMPMPSTSSWEPAPQPNMHPYQVFNLVSAQLWPAIASLRPGAMRVHLFLFVEEIVESADSFYRL